MLACMHGLIRSMPILLRPLQRACGAVGCFRYITTLRLVPETLSWGVTKKVSHFEPAWSQPCAALRLRTMMWRSNELN